MYGTLGNGKGIVKPWWLKWGPYVLAQITREYDLKLVTIIVKNTTVVNVPGAPVEIHAGKVLHLYQVVVATFYTEAYFENEQFTNPSAARLGSDVVALSSGKFRIVKKSDKIHVGRVNGIEPERIRVIIPTNIDDWKMQVQK